ncbi:MAG: YARHG domain-containing protein [Calothrix sp. MO_192.B10]|nr:YARHG domain-containing protein [Calothrix sp. MO_192.B10]
MLLNNRYQIIQTLGSGGFGETFLAEDTQMPSHRRCVIKQLKPIANNPEIYQLVKQRFQREAAILEELGGACNRIPTLYAYFQLDELFYLVQEWIEGDTLTSRIQQQGLFSENAVCKILSSILLILEYVHSQRIIHRDIKPDNIILRHQDGEPVLIDFGAVRESMGTTINSQGSSTSSIIIGTPGYMPSEQAAGRPIYSSDLYSLGITAIYLLTGKQPQTIETDSRTGEILWQTYAPHISPELQAVIDRAIEYHPRDRFATAREMLDALQGADKGEQALINTLPPTELPATQPPTLAASSPEPVNFTPANHHKNALILGGTIGGGVIAAAAIASILLTKSPQHARKQVKQPTTPPVSTNNYPTANQNSFYFLADSAYSDAQNAMKQVQILQTRGYLQAGMFWIPEYANLSGKKLFAVYANKFSDRNSCINLLKTYGGSNPKSYCAFASQDVNASPDRFYFREIATSSTGNKYAWLSQKIVTDADLQSKSGFELDIMRNSIFAHHGRRFQTPGLQQYFENQPWYRPRYAPQSFPNNLLSDVERMNVEYIARYQEINNRRYFKR